VNVPDSWLARNRHRMELELKGTRRRAWATPVLLGLTRALESALRRFATGSILDTGAGTSPYGALLAECGTLYHTIDVEQRADSPTFMGDVQHMPHVRSESYDSVVCSEVLEHLPLPERALHELARVLRPEGHLILSVPFLSRLHEEPHDYFRYTEHGLRALLERHEFEVREIVPIGSVFSFLGHQISTLLIAGTWGMPVVRELAFGVNAALIVLPCRMLDRLTGLARKLPAGYVVVAKRVAHGPAADPDEVTAALPEP
jgi:SAM-dependent methyltransferase